jgi:hypothetical protein
MAKLGKSLGKLVRKFTPLGLVTGAVGGLVGGSGGKKTAAVAPVTDPRQTVMPTADDEATQKAKRRSIIEQRRRSGRMSTILTDGSDKLGG